MGSYKGAEICKLVGIYTLSKLENINFDIELYRDEGLILLRELNGQLGVQLKLGVIRTFCCIKTFWLKNHT